MKPVRCSHWFRTTFNSRPMLVTNSFFSTSQLNHRIQMLITPSTNRYLLWKYALTLPLLSVLTSLTVSCDRVAESLPGKPGFTVAGQVIDSQLKPIYGVTIYSQTPTGNFTTDPRSHIERTGGTIKTDREGRYELTGLDSMATLEFIHPTYLISVVPLNKIASNGQVQLFTRAEALKLLADRRAELMPENKGK